MEGDVVHLSQQQAELLHATMGMVTEIFEVIEELGMEFTIKDPTHLIEEIGDIKWYEAILLRHLDTTSDIAQAANIRKLSTRYPDKFSAHAALNRDLDAERNALES
jgi:NTP pyrophosphatase (non-canonical NTP hydrolase)